jgi:hypothetical protein
VALARKLLIALWRYLETGEPRPGGGDRLGQEAEVRGRGRGEEGVVSQRLPGRNGLVIGEPWP